MMIAIDGRNLQERTLSGIGVYTQHLVDALLNHTAHEYALFSNSLTALHRHISHDRLMHAHGTYPNIFFHPAIRFSGRPRLDLLVQKKTGRPADIFFSPNLHFTALSKNVPHVLTVHDLSFELYKECYSKKRQLWHALVQPKKQCQEARAIVVPSEHTKEDIIREYGIDAKNIHVIYPGVPKATASTTAYSLPEKYLLFIGTIEPRKNIEGIIAGYKESNVWARGIHLVVAGGRGWKSSHLMRMLMNTEGVRYLGYVPDSDKHTLYTQAIACVFPSLYEGFGFPVVEAMSYGTPVITSDRSSLPEIAQGAAYLVNPYSIGSIAAAIERVSTDGALRLQCIEQGKQIAEQYSWEQAAKKMSNIFASVR